MLSCSDRPVPSVYADLSRPIYHADLSTLTFPGYPLPVNLSGLSCLSCPVLPRFSCPVLSQLFWMSLQCFPALVVLPRFPRPSCPFLAVTFWSSCYLCIAQAEMSPRPVQTDLSQPTCPGYPVPAVLYSCPRCNILAVLSSFSFPVYSIPAVVSCCPPLSCTPLHCP